MWKFIKKDSFLAFCLIIGAINMTQGNCKTIPSKKVAPVVETAEDIQNALSGYIANSNKIAVILDYDGTLAQLETRPGEKSMSKEVADVLQRLAANTRVFLSIISGRGLSDIKDKVKISNITYGGNHGIEIENPDGTRSDFELPTAVKEAYSKMLAELQEKVANHGAWVEDKKASLTFHYSETPTDFIVALRDEAIRIIESHGFRAEKAHFAVEGKPPVNWNKGEAAKFILQKNFGNNWRNSVKITYIGDDTTDEDAMKALQGSGRTFRINADPSFETYADFRLPNLDKTPLVLKYIADYYSQ
uniref:Trehalose 6-phosphate phosphatase n=1 Tax=Dolopus genitalis TaxID=2488630 RepID=A0A3G5BIL8_DOLGE|nr:venom polypeptide [Dolopus genitalis]